MNRYQEGWFSFNNVHSNKGKINQHRNEKMIKDFQLFNHLTSCLAFSGAGALPWKKSTSSRTYWAAELQFWRKRKSASLPSSKLTCCPHRGAPLYQSVLAETFCHLYTYSCCGLRLVKRHLCHWMGDFFIFFFPQVTDTLMSNFFLSLYWNHSSYPRCFWVKSFPFRLYMLHYTHSPNTNSFPLLLFSLLLLLACLP